MVSLQLPILFDVSAGAVAFGRMPVVLISLMLT